MQRPIDRLGLLGCGLLTVALIAGCGTAEDVGPPAKMVAVKLQSAVRPSPRESLADAAQRVVSTASSGDCNSIYDLNPLGRPDMDVPDRCHSDEQLAGALIIRFDSFGQGGVVDYLSRAGLPLSGVFILDADGRYRLVFVDDTQQGTDPRASRRVDAAARRAVTALPDKECATFKTASSPRIGPGANDGDVCAYVSNSKLADLLGSYPHLQPIPFGDDGRYGFYGVDGPDGAFTLVFSRD